MALCDEHGVKCGITKYSIAEYKANSKYKIYPVISTLIEDYDQDLEDQLMKEIK